MRSYVITPSGSVVDARIQALPRRIPGLSRHRYVLNLQAPSLAPLRRITRGLRGPHRDHSLGSSERERQR
jgi:hypothetical protein